jgi:enoyl-CoA hydratase/carnithine racemase
MTAVRFAREGVIGTILLSDPPFNRIDAQYAVELADAVRQASESDLRVLVIRGEGDHFSFGGEVREWLGRDRNWFRTFVWSVNASYRAIEGLRVPTVAVVQGAAFGGGFELALACDFIVASEDAVFRCVEVTTAMLPIAGGLQRLAERVGRARASRYAMLGEPIGGAEAFERGVATHFALASDLEKVAGGLISTLANGPTRSYAATRTLLKTWSGGGIAGADAAMLDITVDLFDGEDAQRGFLSTANAFDADVAPPTLKFEGK